MDAISILAHACSETALSTMVDKDSDKELLVVREHLSPGDQTTTLHDSEDHEDVEDDLMVDEDDEEDVDRDGQSSNEGFEDVDKQSNKFPSRGNWTLDEDDKLRRAVAEFGGRNWKKIAEQIADRTDVQCLHRWQKVLRPGLIKGPWTAEVWLRYFALLVFCAKFINNTNKITYSAVVIVYRRTKVLWN
jgi:hypothetical protein